MEQGVLKPVIHERTERWRKKEIGRKGRGKARGERETGKREGKMESEKDEKERERDGCGERERELH